MVSLDAADALPEVPKGYKSRTSPRLAAVALPPFQFMSGSVNYEAGLAKALPCARPEKEQAILQNTQA